MNGPLPKKVFKTTEFKKWQASLKDDVTGAVIDARIKKLQFGLRGDTKSVGQGVCELRIALGPGWRVYYHETDVGAVVLLLLGGNKSTQKSDIKEAKNILNDLKTKQAAAKAKAKAETKARVPSKGESDEQK